MNTLARILAALGAIGLVISGLYEVHQHVHLELAKAIDGIVLGLFILLTTITLPK